MPPVMSTYVRPDCQTILINQAEVMALLGICLVKSKTVVDNCVLQLVSRFQCSRCVISYDFDADVVKKVKRSAGKNDSKV